MRQRVLTISVLLASAAALAACTQPKPPAPRSIGELGAPLGTYMTVEGVRVPDPSKADELLIQVDTVNGKKRDIPLTIAVRGMDRPVMGAHCVLRGYEWGGMEGVPTDPQNPVIVATKSVGFYTWFLATRVISGGTPEK